MSEMAQVVDRDPTAVDACFAWGQRCEGLGAAGGGIGEPQGQRFFGAFREITASADLVLWMWHEDCREVLQPGSVIHWLINLDEAGFLIDVWMDGVMCFLLSSFRCEGE